MKRYALSLLVMGLLSTHALGVEPNAADRSDYGAVRPILAEHCLECHGPDPSSRKGKLSLDTSEGISRVVEPGDPAASELLRRIRTNDVDDRMPPPGHGPSEGLSADEVETLRQWIFDGAPWRPHWSYGPFRKVVAPAVSDEQWIRTPVDRWVLSKLDDLGVKPAREADRRTLIRRVSLDLIGMGPTRDEVDAFLSDPSPDAYARVVDRLLASPHYGEKWARHWLDMARYADSHGYTIDGGRTMWPYRDWVVDAINRDLGFDQFTIEQIAGDLLPDPTNGQRIATGFHRNTQINQEGGAKDEENRVNAVIDRVNTTGAVWLGETLGCAQCHTHKFDPITHREYYQLFAFYNQTEDGGVSTGPTVSLTNEKTAQLVDAFDAERKARVATLNERARVDRATFRVWRPDRFEASEGPELRLRADGSLRSVAHNPQTSIYALEGRAGERFDTIRLEALPDFGLGGMGPGRTRHGNFVLSEIRVLQRTSGGPWIELEIAAATADYSQDNYPVIGAISAEPDTGWAIRPHYGVPHVAHFRLASPFGRDEGAELKGTELRIELHQLYGSNHVLGRFRVALGRTRADTPAPTISSDWVEAWQRLVDHDKTRPRLPMSLVLRERKIPRPTHIFSRGSFLDPGEQVSPGVPRALDHFSEEEVQPDRLGLARWLVHPKHALVHRVTVNRWWQRFFGRGLVQTENDFGLRGATPTHPDLLEWLAQELVRGGFSMKSLHRTIVTSSTYRQSSNARPALDEFDPRNRWLARQSRTRADAEWIRDSALHAAGILTPKIGGPPVQPPQPAGVYAFTQSRKSWKPSTGADRYRRTLYTRIWRSAAYPFAITFDAPVANVACTKRATSNTPLQALTLANDPMMIEIAAALGKRLVTEATGDENRIRAGFEHCLSRPPTEEELGILREYLASQRASSVAQGLEPPLIEQRVWTAFARVLFNLDEFVTRG